MENILQIEIPDSELISRCRNKDKTAFRLLYQRYSGRVYSLSLRLASDTDLAKDITQDTFISVWNNIELFNSESAFYTWLHRIAVNNFLMWKRKNKNNNDISISNEHYNINTVEYFNSFSTRIDTEKAISKLPEQSRIVFVLHDIEGYKHEEIGEMLDIRSGTSKAQLHRARKFLRSELSK